MRSLVQRNERSRAKAPTSLSESTIFGRDGNSDLEFDPWDQTDRPLSFPAPSRAQRRASEDSTTLTGESNPVRSQWLAEHDIHTEFLDAGIGCCWFAQHGDDEPVAGETEDEAIARLTHENRFPWRA